MDNLKTLLKNISKFGLEFIGLYYSSYPAYVADNLDPSNQNRLYVIVPGVFGHPSKPIWVYPKGSSPLVHNLPQLGEVVIVEFSNGKPSQGTWSYSSPLKDSKPSEFRSADTYGFKSPGGHLVLVDEIDNLITIKHKDGQTIRISSEHTTIISNHIDLTQDSPEQSSPLGDDLDSHISDVLSDFGDLVNSLDTYILDQMSACTTPPLSPLVPGLASLLSKVEQVKTNLENHKIKFTDKSHLSVKVKLS